jgi:DDE family transposase
VYVSSKNSVLTLGFFPSGIPLFILGSAPAEHASFWNIYRTRSGIEGTISQGVRVFGMRRSRYRGTLKTHFQDLVIATALNLRRILAWLAEEPLATTRISRFAALVA